MCAIRVSTLAPVLFTGFMFGNPNTALADPVGGPKRVTDEVKAFDTDNFTLPLYAKETTLITLSGDGDTCLELRVYDENNRLVASDTFGLGDDRRVAVTPRWTGKFRIEIKNLGRVYNRYSMRVE